MARKQSRKRKRKRNPAGFWAWASDHWFLTFLLGLAALGTAEVLVRGRESRVLAVVNPKPRDPYAEIPLMPLDRT